MTEGVSSNQSTAEKGVRLLLKSRPALIGYIRNLSGDRDLSEEVFQDICVAVLEVFKESHEGRREAPTDLMAWARGAARNMLKKKFQQNRRLIFVECPELQESIETIYQRFDPPEKREAVLAHLENLNDCLRLFGEPQRELLRLRYVQGCRLAELAKTLKKSEDAVRMLVNRLRNKLADCLQKKNIAEEPKP
jgi:RNA polymerase sigma-70 factor (ECF subfamily)